MLFFGLLIPVLIAAVAYSNGWRPGKNWSVNALANQKTPLDIVKERYARGEISHEEYEELRQDLS